MSNIGTEFSAKNVEDAITEGLRQLGLSRDQVDIDIVSKGSRGILGFGGEPATVRLTPHSTAAPVAQSETTSASASAPETDAPADDTAQPEDGNADADSTPAAVMNPSVEDGAEPVESAAAKDAPDELDKGESDSGGLAEDERDEHSEEADASDVMPGLDDIDREMDVLANDLLARMMDLMGFDVDIVSTWVTPDDGDDVPYLNLDIRGEDLGVLIGRRGETLANIQFLLRLMVNQQMKEWTNITVDVEQYKERRVQQLTQLANRMAEQVATGGRAMSLEPMPANERRIIHIALRDHPAVYTESTGEGERRKVNIVPRE